MPQSQAQTFSQLSTIINQFQYKIITIYQPIVFQTVTITVIMRPTAIFPFKTIITLKFLELCHLFTSTHSFLSQIQRIMTSWRKFLIKKRLNSYFFFYLLLHIYSIYYLCQYRQSNQRLPSVAERTNGLPTSAVSPTQFPTNIEYEQFLFTANDSNVNGEPTTATSNCGGSAPNSSSSPSYSSGNTGGGTSANKKGD